MPRGNNPVGTKTVTVSVTPWVFDLLGAIAKSGVSAKSQAGVAEEMIRIGLNSAGLHSEIVRLAQKVRATK